MGRDATVTRERLLRAGERLFAQHGVDGVRVREINQLAGQRNSSALHYHFGSRDGLLAAIRERHRGPIEDRRIAMLDALEAEGRTHDLRAIVETIAVPFAGELATESGRDYLRILPQVTGRLGLPVGKLPDAFGRNGIRRSLRYAHQCLPGLEPSMREERLLLTIEFLTYTTSRRAHDIDLGAPLRLPEEQFISNIVDMAVGALVAPVGDAGSAPRPAGR
ncbi:MAG: helix-turn-helix domain-containing protein [Acidimicrobiia bacterium]|jgi:AcrR family transcriptional regulator